MNNIFIHIRYFLLISFMMIFFSCHEEDPYGYEIEYEEGYPNILAGTWRAMDWIILEDDFIPMDNAEYFLTIAVDPNDEEQIVLDNIYNSNLRVRAFYNDIDEIFYVRKGSQLENETDQFDVSSISIIGLYFDEGEDGEYLNIFTGMYDQYGDLFDTIVIGAYRGIGFEDVEEYELNFLFEN